MSQKTGIRSGPASNLWKGGRSVASNGYVLIRVGTEHHLADVRGYAYEHRVVAEQKLGRRLMPGEQVHHVNGVKTDNRPENLEAVTSAEHGVEHRSGGKRLMMPGENNELAVCACGCGSMFARYDDGGRPRLYVSGHNPPESPTMTGILAELRDGPVSRGALAEALGTSVQAVASALSKMKARSMVRPVGRGVWEAING